MLQSASANIYTPSRRSFEEILATVPHSTTVELIYGGKREHYFSESDREAIAREQILWDDDAERAGWTPAPEGQWQRPAYEWEPSNVPESNPRLIRLPDAQAVREWDAARRPAADRTAQLTVEGLADAMLANRHDCTEDVLAVLGFPVTFQRENRDAAVAIANQRSVAHVEGSDLPEERIVAMMRVTAGDLLPNLQELMVHWRQSGIPNRQINRYARRVINLLGKDLVSIARVN